MAGVLTIVQDSGYSSGGYFLEVGKNISSFVTIDNATANKVDYPLQIPAMGTTYSYEVWIRCRCDLAPYVKMENFKVWYSLGIPTGHTITVNSDIISAYTQPVNILSTKGTRVDFTTKNSEGTSIPLTGILTNVGDYTSYLIFQLQVGALATLGSFSVEYILQWDEE